MCLWMMYESLNGVSGFVFGFRFGCLVYLSVDVCMNDVWMSERIVRMLWRICLNNVWISEWSVRICFWISFSFFWVVLSKSFCGCVYEWCMNLWMECQDLFLNFVLGVLCNLSVDVCTNDVWMSERIVRMLWRICLIMYESLNGVSGFASFSFFWVVLF